MKVAFDTNTAQGLCLRPVTLQPTMLLWTLPSEFEGIRLAWVQSG